jgi:hypothetical protein
VDDLHLSPSTVHVVDDLPNVGDGISAKTFDDSLPPLRCCRMAKRVKKYEPTIDRKRPTITPQKNSLVRTSQTQFIGTPAYPPDGIAVSRRCQISCFAMRLGWLDGEKVERLGAWAANYLRSRAVPTCRPCAS